MKRFAFLLSVLYLYGTLSLNAQTCTQCDFEFVFHLG
jgi:hypothetical protein